MRTSKIMTAAVCVVSLIGCERTPTLPGTDESLLCGTDTDCPEGFRCSSKVCIVNSPPVLEPLDPEAVEIGTQLHVTARANDADGDAPSFTWRQVSGPTTLEIAAPEQAELVVTPTAFGGYTFEVEAHDPYTLAAGTTDLVSTAVLAVQAYCTMDAQCSGGLRCFEQECARNVLPSVDPFPGVVTVAEGDGLSVTAIATDPEGDAVSFTWRQLRGPPVLAEPLVSATLVIDALSARGLYLFEVAVADPYDPQQSVSAATSAELEVLVQPLGGAVYVSDTGADDDTCGGVDAPCASITAGLERLRASTGVSELLVAATSGLAPYVDCLDVRDGEVVSGCYDPVTWQLDPELRRQCRVACPYAPQSDGSGELPAAEQPIHRVAGSGRVSDLTLSIAVEAVGTLPIGTLLMGGGAPMLEDVDILTADCGPGCSVYGLISDNAAPTLRGVEVAADVAGFSPIEMFAGMVLVGGAPVVTGTTAVGEAGHRGSVVMNAPVNAEAIGIFTILAEATITDMVIEGGLGPRLRGVAIQGGGATLRGNHIDLLGFGTRFMSGIEATVCTSTNGCDCMEELPACALPPAGDEPWWPALAVADNTIVLAASSATEGLVPCSGVGVGVSASNAAAEVSGNSIAIGDHFSLGIGAFSVQSQLELDATGARRGPLLGPNLFAGNEITVGGAEVDPLCEYLNQGQPAGESSGAMGLVTARDPGTEITGNTVVVGDNEAASTGLLLIDGGGQRIARNVIEVAGGASGIVGSEAIGVALVLQAAGEIGSFEGNQVTLGSGARRTAALVVGSYMDWRIANNTLHGGLGQYTTGLTVFAQQADPLRPEVVHNTIHGGGDASHSLVSRAVLLVAYDLTADPPTCEETGLWVNNLLDGGDAAGRRVLVENLFCDATSSFLATRDGNIGQFHGAALGPTPMRVFLREPDAASGADDALLPLHVFLQEAGEVVTLFLDASGNPLEGPTTPIGDRPAWAWTRAAKSRGDVDDLVVALPGAIGVSYLAGDEVQPFFIQPALTYVSGTPSSIQPFAAVRLEADGTSPPDLVFTARESAPGAADGAIWLMAGRREGGYAPAVALGSWETEDPSLLTSMVPESTGLQTVGQTVTLALDSLRVHVHPFTQPAAVGSGLGVTFDLAHFERATSMGPREPIDLESISVMELAQLMDAGGANTPDPLDLIIIGVHAGASPTTELFVFLNPNVKIAQAPVAARFESAMCAGSVPTAFSVAEAHNAGSRELWVGCEDGAIELWNLGSTFYRLPAPFDYGIPPGRPPVAQLSAVRLGIDDCLLTAVRAGTHDIDIYRFHASGGFPPMQIEGPISHTFLTDAAMRSLTDGRLLADFSSLSEPAGITMPEAGECELALRNGGDPLDLHLAPEDAVCKDAGVAQAQPELDDVDGAGTRTDANPDVGADELP